jgi:hypothetical protein
MSHSVKLDDNICISVTYSVMQSFACLIPDYVSKKWIYMEILNSRWEVNLFMRSINESLTLCECANVFICV